MALSTESSTTPPSLLKIAAVLLQTPHTVRMKSALATRTRLLCDLMAHGACYQMWLLSLIEDSAHDLTQIPASKRQKGNHIQTWLLYCNKVVKRGYGRQELSVGCIEGIFCSICCSIRVLLQVLCFSCGHLMSRFYNRRSFLQGSPLNLGLFKRHPKLA